MAGRQRFLGDRQVTGGRQRFTGTEPAQPEAKPHGGGGGIGGIASRFGSDLYDTAIHSPSGIYHAGKDLVATEKNLVTGKTGKQPIDKDLKAAAQGFKQDVQHPLRHPGNTFLDAIGAVSLGAGTVARVGEVGRALKAGETAGDVARAAVKGPKPETRVLKYNGQDVPAGQYSRAALKRSTQRLRDSFQQRFPDVRLPVRNLHERVGHELKQNRRITDSIQAAPAAALAKTRLSRPELKAVQVVAEGVPVEKRIAFHEEQLAGFKPGQTKLIAATKKEIALLRGARRHVVDVEGTPRIDPRNDKLIGFYQRAHSLAHQRESMLAGTDRLVREKGKVVRTQALTDEQVAGRLTKPAALMGHVVKPEDVPGLFRVPYKSKQPIAGIFKPQGYKGGIPKTPGDLTHGFQGALLKSGTFRNDLNKTVAESYLEAHRFAAVMKHRDTFLNLAHDARTSENDVPIRTDSLLNKSWPKAIQDISEKPDLGKKEIQALDHHYEDLRSTLFPDVASVEQEMAKGEHPQVKWIDKRALGGLNEPNPSVAGSTRRAVGVFDGINNASRAAILYLKPAYAVPNILGNAALNIVQQGWGAPAQVARSARVFWKLDHDTRMKVKLAMGEGISGSLHTERGVGSKAINAMANMWQKPVDTPFRLNAFFYEARRSGYTTAPQIKALFDDESKLVPIAREANQAIIDYGDLNPFEQSVVRRVIFFYPWVKGSTRYAGRFATDHPIQSAGLGQAGKLGAAQDQKDLGPLPSYAEGLFKSGERGSNPLTLNPSSAGILQTPAQLGKALSELRSGHPGEAFTLTQNLTPALAALLALIGASSRQRNQSPLSAAQDQLVGGLPALTTIQQELHPPSESSKPRLYPRTREDVLLHFLLGGLAPTPINLRKAEQSKYLEDHPR